MNTLSIAQLSSGPDGSGKTGYQQRCVGTRYAEHITCKGLVCPKLEFPRPAQQLLKEE